ncbi:MAG TPA: 3-hydroxyacyl-CoA dehydrogenase NAD-binding domain-containing protein [Acidimicrobiales bacterium]|nr:3-hydroxyacyl-CoA dehydrogenase NAD-binding domain-containing protein [Acidimicrobiales bacterium]
MSEVVAPVVVIGAGTMGRGIAVACVTAGFPTTIVDVDAAVLAAARDAATTSIAKRDPEVDVDALLSTSDDLERAVKGAGAVIEAVPEILPLKLDIFERLGRFAEPAALLASNTSTMSVTRLAGACARPERVVGMHFFNPAHRMPLVEVIHGSLTAWPAVEDAVTLARRLGKEPVVVRDVPGFVTSRLGLLLGNEAMRLVEERVASADDVDKAMRLGYRHPMGPLELADLVGLDARLNNVRSMFEQVGNEQYRPPAILEQLVADGHLGRKTGRGFYRYGDDGTNLGPAADVTA